MSATSECAGHGTIGLAATLRYLDRIAPGHHRVETPVGVVSIEVHDSGEVSVDNVASYRLAKDVTVLVPQLGPVTGDIAWGGNWFFLVSSCPLELCLENVESLTDYAWQIRGALAHDGITGASGEEIDHIEFFGPPTNPLAHSRNFVLCPGKAYDRSPCGTGTSAKLACLHADGKLREGETWRQEGILGGLLEGTIRLRDGHIYPRIKGIAFVNGESRLLIDERDPFCWGVRH